MIKIFLDEDAQQLRTTCAHIKLSEWNKRDKSENLVCSGTDPSLMPIPSSSCTGLCVTVMTCSELIFNFNGAKWESRSQCHELPALVL